MNAKVRNDKRWPIAEKFCRDQLIIMDGSFDAAITRLGMWRFEEMVESVMKAMTPFADAQHAGERGIKDGTVR